MNEEERRDTLYVQLEALYAEIEKALAKGEDTREWENLWINLLKEYESVCDKLQQSLT